MRDRTLRTGVGAIALLPVVTAALLVRPVPAESQEQAFGLYALTVSGASTTTAGEAGAGGGLAVIDSGAPSVRGRLDSSPSGSVRSAPIEPGTLFRTVVGLANNEAGGETIPVPTADAAYPGTGEAEVEGTGPQAAGPFTATGYHAVSRASELEIAGTAETADQTFTDGAASANALTLATALRTLAREYPTAGFRVASDASAYRTEGGRVTAHATADPAGGTLEAAVRSTTATTTVLGQIELTNVTSTATVTLADGERTADAVTTVGGVTVAGVPVELTGDGLVVAGTEVLPGQAVADLSTAVNEVLAAAGVTIEPLIPREEVGEGFAEADAQGVRITIATAPNPQVPGNTLTLILGQAEASLADEPPFESPTMAPVDGGSSSPVAPSASGISVPTGGVSGSVSAGSPPALDSGVAAPEVAAPDAGAGAPELVQVAGRRISKRVALAAFGGWQLLSLSICTLAAFSLRRGSEVLA